MYTPYTRIITTVDYHFNQDAIFTKSLLFLNTVIVLGPGVLTKRRGCKTTSDTVAGGTPYLHTHFYLHALSIMSPDHTLNFPSSLQPSCAWWGDLYIICQLGWATSQIL